jgi:hypothetical protein
VYNEAMKKLTTASIIATGVITSSLVSSIIWNGVAHGEWDFPGLQQQVQHVTEVTNNHEGRITNLEAKISTPSDQPTPTPVVITQVVTQEAPQVTPAPVTAAQAVAVPEPTPVATPTPKKPLSTQVARRSDLIISTWTGADAGWSNYWNWYCDRTYTDNTTESIFLGRVSSEGYGDKAAYNCQDY